MSSNKFSLRSAVRPSRTRMLPIPDASVVLKKYGTNAHLWLPGVGYMNGEQAGNYIDSAGTQAGLVDNPVGLVMDAEGSLGAELVTNGDFSNGLTSWVVQQPTAGSVAVLAGECRFNSTDGSLAYIQQSICTVGRTYSVSLNVINVSSGLLAISDGSANYITFNTTGAKSFVFVATSSVFQVKRVSGVTDITIDNVSVREVTGAITAAQGTTANKPILRRGAVNLLLRSEEFNTSWATTGTISVNAIAAPNATTTADLLTASATTFSGVAQQTFSGVASGATYTLSVFVKKNNWRYVGLRFNTSIFGATEQIPFYDFDTDTVSNGGVTAATITRTIIGDGWVRVAVTYTATTTGGGCQIWLTNSVGATQPAKSGTESVYIWGAQLELGSTASEYIPTTTAAASSSSGDYYWQFDGSNDSLALSSVPFQMADDHCVVAGYRPISLAANADLYAQRSTASANPITLLRVSTSGAVQALHRDDAGTIQTASSTGSVAAGSSCVASMRRSSGVAIARRNGGNQSPDGTQAFGTTTFTSAAIGVSPLATPGGFSNGSIYPVIAIKGTVSDADLLVLERWVGSLSGVSI